LAVKAEYNINGFIQKSAVTVDLSIKGSYILYQHKTVYLRKIFRNKSIGNQQENKHSRKRKILYNYNVFPKHAT